MSSKKTKGQGQGPDENKEDSNLLAPPTPIPTELQRIYSKTREFVTDLFMSSVAHKVQRIGLAMHPEKDPSAFIQVAHQHPYRTFDSDGKKLMRTSPIGGHYHVLEVEETGDPNRPLKILSCSGPRRLVRKKSYGIMKTLDLPLNDYDDHTHTFDYLGSTKIQARIKNAEAEKVISIELAKGAAPAGVTGAGRRG